MRTIAVDDEPWMLKRFSVECEGIPDMQLLGTFRSPVKALEFAKANNVELAFLDMEMPEMTGLQLAEKLRAVFPDIIVIFISAYERYMAEAFMSKTADYYIMKPYTTEDIEAAVDRARLLSGRLRKKVYARTFGNFEFFVDGTPIDFPDAATKELLALLIDRQGGVLSSADYGMVLSAEIDANNAAISFNRILKKLTESLHYAKVNSLVDHNNQGAYVHTDVMDCDLFKYMDGDLKTMRQFSGVYMTGYKWAEERRNNFALQSKLLDRYSDIQIRNSLGASFRYINDEKLTLTYMNEGFLTVVGYTQEEIESQLNNSLRAMILREDLCKFRNNCENASKETDNVEFRLVSKIGDRIWVMGKSERIKKLDNSELFESACILIDISDLKAEQHNLEQAASRDGLTGLYNRAAARGIIDDFLSSGSENKTAALFLLDVDNFKAVNDTYGHPFADTVLKDVATVLTQSFRKDDVVCRLGGDEMMVFLSQIGTETIAREKLGATENALREKLLTKTDRGELSCSFGAAFYPNDGDGFDALYKCADQALYSAKKRKNCTAWFSDIT